MAKFPPLLEAPVLKTIWHFPSVPAGSEDAFLRFRRPVLFGLGFAELVRALPEGPRLPFDGTVVAFGSPPSWLDETFGPVTWLSLSL